MSGITAHMIVKNEDRWVWYAINSILPHVDQFLITDTGSTDNTVEIIKSIDSRKIVFAQVAAKDPRDVTAVRANQLAATKTTWVWIVDGDEVYPNQTAKECVELTKDQHSEGILVRRYDLLGDVYHKQSESVGSYSLFGHTGHLLIRLINLEKLQGISYRGDYPSEGFYDQAGLSVLTHNPSLWPATTHALYHAMYLQRSSLGSNLSMFNRSKYKVEKGGSITDVLPQVFSLPRPNVVPDPLHKRGLMYELTASLITPIKKLKRRLT